MAKLSLKLVVEKEKNMVVFAESDEDFVDILFSFLTLPMGTIVRLLGKNSGVGCMDKLYESVEKLDTKYLQTKACRTMLLQPRGASEILCEDLTINVDDPKPRRTYRCPKFDCLTKTHCLFSNIQGAQCPCGQVMDEGMEWTKEGGANVYGVFVKGATRFMISDDLNVTPISTGATLSLLQRLGIDDASTLQNRTVDVSKDEILSLLKSMLLSETPLTDVFLRKPGYSFNNHEKEIRQEFEPMDTSRIKIETDDSNRSKMVCLRLLESKSTNKVAYAESGEDLVDHLFSFLTFPLGSIAKLLNMHSSLGCVDHLYQSVEVLSNYIKSEDCKNMLLDPKLATHFGCSNQLLRIDEKLSSTTRCEFCFKVAMDKCFHGVKDVTITKINPKLPIPGTEHGGGFANVSVKFMVTNEMMVTPLSPSITVNAIKELQVPITSLVERDITCGEAEVLNMLKACLLSRAVLNNVFSRKNWRRMPLA